MGPKLDFEAAVVVILEYMPKQPYYLMVPISIAYCIIMSYVCILVFMQFIYMKWDLLDFADNIEAFFSWATQYGTIGCIVYQRQKLQEVVDEVKNFRKTKDLPDEALQKDIDNIRKRNMGLQKPLLVVLMICGVLTALQPLFGKPLPIGIWTMEPNTIWYKILVMLEIVIVCPSYIYMAAIICIFLDCCFEVTIQFKVLTHKMDVLLSQEDYSEESFNECLEEHSTLLKFLKEVGNFFSSAFAVYYITALPMMCIEFYILCESEDMETVSKYGAYCITRNSEFAFYCIPSEYVASEAQAFADHLYSLKWYSNYRKRTWKSLLQAIERAQRKICFRAGGLVPVNPNTVVQVFKTGWSACAVLKSMKRSN